MSGNARTTKFHFSTASVLVGAQSEFLSLNTAAHSLGLVKNVAVSADPKIVDLTQGIMNDLVDQQVNGMDVKVSAEVYEYTPKNLAYGLGLDGALSKYTSVISTTYSPAANIIAAATTFTIAGDHTTDFVAGAYGFLQEGTDDYTHIFKVLSSAYAAPDTTVTFTGYPIPAGMSFSAVNGRLGLVNKIDFDPNAVTTFQSCRIIGTSKQDKRPVVMHFPKIKITKGFSMKFASDNYGNMPFEFSPYTPLASDVGYSPDFSQRLSVTL